MSKNILITGGAGYIGTHVAKHFLEAGYSVVIYDNFLSGFHQPIDTLKKIGEVISYEGDITDKSALTKIFTDHQIDVVIHCAALLSVDESMKKPELYFRTNVGGTLNLLEVMNEQNVKNMVFSSSCSVFGESEYLPVDEKHPLHPTNPYGESKLISEKMMYWYCQAHDFRVVSLRYFNVCGASSDGTIGDSKRPSPHLVQNLVLGAMELSPFELTCPKVDTPDRTPIRDYIDVEDLATAHYLAYEYLQKHAGFEAFNLGNGKGFSVKEMVSKVEELFGVKIPAKKPTQARKGEYAAVYADPSKAHKLLGWKVTKSLAQSVKSLKNWYEKNPQGYAY
jgi:UDP-glucose 4-epimerase